MVVLILEDEVLQRADVLWLSEVSLELLEAYLVLVLVVIVVGVARVLWVYHIALGLNLEQCILFKNWFRLEFTTDGEFDILDEAVLSFACHIEVQVELI